MIRRPGSTDDSTDPLFGTGVQLLHPQDAVQAVDVVGVVRQQPSRRTLGRVEAMQRTLTFTMASFWSIALSIALSPTGQAFRERPADVAHFLPFPIHAHGTSVVRVVWLSD